MVLNTGLYSVKAFLLLDGDGNRLIAKYYDCPEFNTVKDQKYFEKSIFEKSKKSSTDIMILDGYIAVYKNNLDLFFYLVVSVDENELIAAAALNVFYDAISIVLRNQIDKRSLLDRFDMVLLALDETIDNGIILETEPQTIAQRVTARRAENTDLPFSEQSITQALQNARNQLARTLLN